MRNALLVDIISGSSEAPPGRSGEGEGEGGGTRFPNEHSEEWLYEAKG